MKESLEEAMLRLLQESELTDMYNELPDNKETADEDDKVDTSMVDGIVDDVLVITDPEVSSEEYEEVIERAQEIVDATPEGEIPFNEDYVGKYAQTCPICGGTFVTDEILEPGATCPICLDTPEAFVMVGQLGTDEEVADEYAEVPIEDEKEEIEKPEFPRKPIENEKPISNEEEEEEKEPIEASEVVKTADNKLEESKQLEEDYNAQERFDAIYKENGFKVVAKSDKGTYMIAGKIDGDDIKLYSVDGYKENDPLPTIYIDHDYKGTITNVEIGWPSYSNKTIEMAEKMVEILNEAIPFAKSINGADFSDIVKNDLTESKLEEVTKVDEETDFYGYVFDAEDVKYIEDLVKDAAKLDVTLDERPGHTTIEIELGKTEFVDGGIANLSDDLYYNIEKYIHSKYADAQLLTNNTKSVFWLGKESEQKLSSRMESKNITESKLEEVVKDKSYVLTDEDKKILADWGEKPEDIEQIQRAIEVTTFGLSSADSPCKDEKKITAKEAYEILGQELFLSGIDRSAFHWDSGRRSEDGKSFVSFDSSKLFETMEVPYCGKILKESNAETDESDEVEYDENAPIEKNMLTAVCSGDDLFIKNAYNKQLIKPNTRYEAFGSKHSYIMAALRNNQFDTANLLRSFGETIRKDEVNEYKGILAKRTYEDDVTKTATEESKEIKTEANDYRGVQGNQAIIDKLEKLKSDLLNIEYVTKVEFDTDGYLDGIEAPVTLVTFDIPINDAVEYSKYKKQMLNNILNTFETNGVNIEKEEIEDNDTYYYFVSYSTNWEKKDDIVN